MRCASCEIQPGWGMWGDWGFRLALIPLFYIPLFSASSRAWKERNPQKAPNPPTFTGFYPPPYHSSLAGKPKTQSRGARFWAMFMPRSPSERRLVSLKIYSRRGVGYSPPSQKIVPPGGKFNYLLHSYPGVEEIFPKNFPGIGIGPGGLD